MVRWLSALIVTLLLLGTGYLLWQAAAQRGGAVPSRVLLLQTTTGNDAQQSHEAFESVLTEEGVPHGWVNGNELLHLDPGQAARDVPIIVLPDAAGRKLSAGLSGWLTSYTTQGGTLLVVFDAGTRDSMNRYSPQAPLRSVTGVDNSRYNTLGDSMYTLSPVQFVSARAAQDWGVTPGKLGPQLNLLGYGYGKLTYPVIDARVVGTQVQVWASGQRGVPVLAQTPAGAGRSYWVNLPLGRLKASGDDLPLRMVLRRVVRDADLPRLIPTPRGRGTLMVNWHVDANPDWLALPQLIRQGVISPSIRNSFHITAGPDRTAPGDHLGFDACGKGRELALSLKKYGTLGDHGGWGHEIFTNLLVNRGLTQQAIRDVDLNSQCIAALLGRPVTEYSAPNGTHPQPGMTKLLEQRGFLVYYYTGDSGSAPNRTFYNGKMVSQKVLAAPITPYHNLASVGEFGRNHINPAEIQAWLSDLVKFVERERVVRLIYTHPYDLYLRPQYLPAWQAMTREIVQGVQRGVLNTLTMQQVARFTQRFMATQAQFTWQGRDLKVSLHNPQGLRDISLQVPRRCQGAANPAGLLGQGAARWVADDRPDLSFTLHCP